MTTVAPAELPKRAERFLRDLGSALSKVPAAERDEIVAEIRSHLEDRLSQGASDILAGFSDPGAYAAAFMQERALASAVAQGTSWAIGGALLRGARTLGWWYTVLVLGLLHVYGLVFLALALAKPIFPRNVGLFVHRRPSGTALSFGGIFGEDLSDTTEILGWWAIPILVLLGVLALWGANRTLRALGRWRLKRIRQSRVA
jgi:uncharacterized membrane protein